MKKQSGNIQARPDRNTGDDIARIVTSKRKYARSAQSDNPFSNIGVICGVKNGQAILLLDKSSSIEDVEVRVGGHTFLAVESDLISDDPLLNQNHIIDSDFSTGTSRWQPLVAPDGWSVGLDHPDLRIHDWRVAFIHQYQSPSTAPVELAYRSDQENGLIPLRPGANYQFSGIFVTRRCQAYLVVRVLDSNGILLGEATKPTSSPAKGHPDSYNHSTLNFTVPPTACSAQLILRKDSTAAGEKDSWFFFSRTCFSRVTEPATLTFSLPRYAPRELALLQRLDVTGVQAHNIQLPRKDSLSARLQVDAVERASGRPLIGSPLVVLAPQISGAITAIEGTTVIGWAKVDAWPFVPVEVSLFVDGRAAGTVMADEPHGEGACGFRLPLPSNALDDQPHRISVRLLTNDALVSEVAEVLPAASTPWSALVKHGGVQLPAKLSIAASYRYEALRAHVQALGTEKSFGKVSALPARRLIFSQLGQAHERVVVGLDRNPPLAPLAFPKFDTPRVSIIIPVHNKFPVTHNCLAALLLAYNDTTFEVIVVDDGSSDATRQIEHLISGITYCRNETAEGFVSACNLGASKARGDFIVLLNNDTEPTVRWLDELLYIFDNFDDVGLAGSKLIYPDGRLQEAGGIVWGNGAPWNYGRLGNPAEPKYCYTRQADYLSGAAIMMPRKLWQQLDGLSEEFRPAYYEDTDLAFKVREAGYRTVYAASSVVIHFEGISSGTSTASGMKRFQEVNRPQFLRKWRKAYRHFGTDTTMADLEKDRGVGLRALFIDAQTPRPDNDAGSHAAVQEMRAMQALGAKVTFLPENLAYLGTYTTDLQRAGIETVYAPFVLSVEEFLRTRGAEFDVIYITRYMVASRHLEAVRRHAPQAKVLFCNADLHFLRELREAILADSPDKLQASLVTRDAELSVMRNVEVVLSYNPVEHAVIVSHNLNSTRIVTAPWIVDVANNVPAFDARADVAFLGGFGHPPNAEAVRYFVREVMPLLRRRVAGINFLIYGSGMPPEIEALGAVDVIIKGYVENLADIYESCRVFVAPLLTGAGVKGKVVDALSFGVPCVLSPIAAEGIGLGEGSDALIARSPEEWADAIETLYHDATRWSAISDRALAFTRRNFSFERGVEQMRVAVEAAGLVPDKGMALRRARLGI